MLDCVTEPAPILESEDSKAYNEFLEAVIATVRPADVIEQMWTQRVVNWSWEIRHYSELKQFVIKSAMPEALRQILAPLTDGPWRFGARDVYDPEGALRPTPSMEYANDYIRGDAKRIKEINGILNEANLTMKEVEFRAMDLVMDKLEQISEVIAKLNARCNALLGEIERRQKVLAANLRRAVDAECKQVESKAA